MTARSIVSTDIWLLSALVTVFWCMGSACRIHLHANFLHFLPRQTFTMIHILPSTQQTRWERISQDGSTCFFTTICAEACVRRAGSERHVWGKKQRKQRRRRHLFVPPCSFICSHAVVSNPVSAPLGHRENSSICDSRLRSSAPLAPWGKTLSLPQYIKRVVLCLHHPIYKISNTNIVGLVFIFPLCNWTMKAILIIH